MRLSSKPPATRNLPTRRPDERGSAQRENPGRASAQRRFCGGADTLPGKGAVAKLREAAFERFDAAGLPHRRVEEWKYTDLRALMREARPLAGPAGAKPKGDIAAVLTGVETDRIAIVNGRYEPAWSDFMTSDPGVAVDELFKFLADDPDYRLGQAPGTDDPAYWLNTAFMSGGVALRVKAGAAVKKPIHVAISSPAMRRPRCIHARW